MRRAGAPFDEGRPSLKGCFAIRHWVPVDPQYPLKPARRVDHLIDVFEPLDTKAPGPGIAQPYCCLINTVIFYARPYAKALPLYHARWRDGTVHTSTRGFEIYDQVRTLLRHDDIVEYAGDRFEVGGGRVMWAARKDDLVGRRWWMRYSARRVTP